ncbi:MAG TPA: carboxyvinyl-carboxyphosphonate phosphorylmutase [Cyanobacteria bacterium UBA11149]|nr:carboxyvinyl-carboxyphosphonate phosphorylmutase [Cyanobacteria bacterium UBA11367]HBE56082.1 carboxyvinyl-carboxyphosphonate phosphorylmutase [Cyanobacteria bacterium UBA11366]HBK64084.1 carboxyvinyl-carboxyphosphonate phosphorylmutase [Cyanobacteria bacterium UBA11166]HBR74984.1 carboxyvinyl-carboxyphosphonate phosphorylmutase [Cyanobacteria bacterium UBA11159]HBS71490.1 carboxyvinyl-carboxyphosphonate phosphorylmutase [Cyanobacteria bacterium UBA11153]HBW87603.1 carboxyvinyl-carboxyphosp
MSQSQKLRQILQQPGILIVPGVYDCISAKLAEAIGFEFIFTSGFGISGASLGRPDYGFLTATEMLYSVGRMAESVTIPLIADIDTGYGNPLNVIRTVTEAIKLGVAGIILEDQEWPKKCGHFQGKRVISQDEHIQKIQAAIQARGDSGLAIIARTDARATLGLEEAIRRGQAYFAAGADVVFVEAPQSREDLVAIASALPDVPLLANMIEGGKTPLLSKQEAQELGFKIVVYPLSGLFAATKAMMNCLSHLRENGTTLGFNDLVSFQEFEEIIDVPIYRELEAKFAVRRE